jgi:pilus assembly protein CpaB
MSGNKVALVLSLLCALIASFLVYRTLRQKSAPQVVEPPKVAVVYAKKPIPARSAVTLEQLELRRIPVELVNPDAIRECKAAVGLIARSSIMQGETVLKGRLLQKGQPYSLSLLIPQGMRAMTIAINEIKGVAGFLKPGERVDVIGTYEFAEPKTQHLAWTVLQDAEILAVAQNMGDPERPQKGDAKTAGQKDPAKLGASVTLAVTPEQAQQVALSEELGALRLTLRPLLAEQPAKLAPLAETALLPRTQASPRKKGRVAPVAHTAPAQPQGQKIEVISGGKTQYITVY